MKFVLFVEGPTERNALPEFLRRWLNASGRLPSRVGIRPVAFEGWSDYERHIAKKVALHLSGQAGTGVIAAIGLLDLYGPTFYPESCETAAKRQAWAKKHLENRVGHPRFRQYFAVHETEAWLLSEPAILPPTVSRVIRDQYPAPELVNMDEPPAKLLDRLFRQRIGRPYRKIIDGSDYFGRLSPDAAYAKCPSLRKMMDEMMVLARVALGMESSASPR